ncbi:MAG: hypothetical protein WBG67_08065, partial [Thermoanaerobaculia bacterium]
SLRILLPAAPAADQLQLRQRAPADRCGVDLEAVAQPGALERGETDPAWRAGFGRVRAIDYGRQ